MFTAKFNSLVSANRQFKSRPQQTMTWTTGCDLTQNNLITQQKRFQTSSFSMSNRPYPARLNFSNQISKPISFDHFDSRNKFNNFSSKIVYQRKVTDPDHFIHSHKRHILEVGQPTAPKSFHIQDILKQDNHNVLLTEESHNQNTDVLLTNKEEQTSTDKISKYPKTKNISNTHFTNVTESKKETHSSEKSMDAKSHFLFPVEINNNDSPRSAFTVPSASGTKENLRYHNILPNHALKLKYLFDGCPKTNLIYEPRINNDNTDFRNTSNSLQSYSSTYRVQNKTIPRFGSYGDRKPILSCSSFSQSPSATSLSATSTTSLSTSPSSLSSLSQIYHNNHDRKKFQCPQCRYLTDRKNNLMRHIITMHQDSGKVLECCGMAFQSKSSLREHNAVFHSGGYRCQICSRNFCRKALLRRHLTVHSGQKDFYCSLCGYATSHKSNLERHQKVHNKRFIGRLDFRKMNNNNINTKNNNARYSKTIYKNKIPHRVMEDMLFPDIIKSIENNTNTDKVPFKNDPLNREPSDDNDHNILNVSISSDDDSEFDVIDVEMPFEGTFSSPIKDVTHEIPVILNTNSSAGEINVCREKNKSSHLSTKTTKRPNRISKKRGFLTSRIRSTHSHTPMIECDQINSAKQNPIDEYFQGADPEKRKTSIELDKNKKPINPSYRNTHADQSKCVELSNEVNIETQDRDNGDDTEKTTICSLKVCDFNSNFKQENTSCIPDDLFSQTLENTNPKEDVGYTSGEDIYDNSDEGQGKGSSCESVNPDSKADVFTYKLREEKIFCKVVHTDCDDREKSVYIHEVQGEKASNKSVHTDCKDGECERETDYSLKENDLITDTNGGLTPEKNSYKPNSAGRNVFKVHCRDNTKKSLNDLKRHPSKKSRLCTLMYSCPWCHRQFQNQIDNESHTCSQQEDRQPSVCYDVPISVMVSRKNGLCTGQTST